jgi:predicted metalloprotease with PDZ domain
MKRASRTTAQSAALRYRIEPIDLNAHLFEIVLDIARPDPAGQVVELPAWIPGSYMIREFARHVVAITAARGGKPIHIDKFDKARWRIEPGQGPVSVTCRVYAFDLSVRGAFLDSTHGFFNGTCVFLRVAGQDHEACEVEIVAPADAATGQWRVSTTLPLAGAKMDGFGHYRAPDYDALIDHPVVMGEFTTAGFTAGGAAHSIAMTGAPEADLQRLARDLRKVCAVQARLFEPETGRTPFDRFAFQVTAVNDGYGGLEHRSSTALITRRDDLPWPGMRGAPEGYRRFLGLCSHEYFHAWHVKRIKPEAFVRYRLDTENYTKLLWVFEGFTSYYDDLMLARAGVISSTDYLGALAQTIGQVLRGPGRLRQSLEQSSHDAWIKYYRQDENSPNSIVSYYAKGALVALMLDALIRTRTSGSASLDDVMRLMWQRFGRSFYDRDGRISAEARGLEEDGFDSIVREATGISVTTVLRSWVGGTEELPLSRMLARLGVKMQLKAAEGAAACLGLRMNEAAGRLRITSVLVGSSGCVAGLAAGDEIMAVDGVRADLGSLNRRVRRIGSGGRLTLHLFRRDELREAQVEIGTAPPTEASLSLADPVDESTARLRKAWLTGR